MQYLNRDFFRFAEKIKKTIKKIVKKDKNIVTNLKIYVIIFKAEYFWRKYENF